MDLAVLFGVCLLVSGVAIRLGILLAGHLGIMDRPGGHKQHEAVTPFVGGFGIIAVVVGIFLLADRLFSGFPMLPLQGLFLGALVLFLTGLADDIWHLHFKPRLVIQALVALSMIFIGGVELRSLGQLAPGITIDPGFLAIPLTVFATVGLINAVNMIDGIDGLSGSVSLVSLAFAAWLAHHGSNGGYVVLIVALMGGVGGFLYYNLRYPGNRRARVFLGDNGSMLLGFVFAWLFIALSQGEDAAMTPTTALWIFALPLMDTVGVMLRRIWLGKSPFRPDRHHLHHLFFRAGFRVCDIVVFAVLAQLVLALLGIGGLLLGVPEYLMFWSFMGVFGVYFLVIARPWRFVPWLRRINRRFGLPSVQVRGIFIGYVCREKFREVLDLIADRLGSAYDYQLRVYRTDRSTSDGRNLYCVVRVPAAGNDPLIGAVRRGALRVRRLLRQPEVEVRLFLRRDRGQDPRASKLSPVGISGDRRSADRRRLRSTLIYSTEGGEEIIESNRSRFQVSVPPA